MWRVVTGMNSIITAQAGTALSPEWDRGFDEAFTDLVTADPELVREEFDALIGANFNETPAPPGPPADRREPPPSPPGNGQTDPAHLLDQSLGTPTVHQRSPP